MVVSMNCVLKNQVLIRRVHRNFKPLHLDGVEAVARENQLSTPSMVPQTIEFPSGKLRLKGYFWKPAGTGPCPALLFNHGSGGADADHTAGMPITNHFLSMRPRSAMCRRRTSPARSHP